MKRTSMIGLYATALAALLAGFALPGCSFGRIAQPDGYLEIDSGPKYLKRYLSVDGNVIAVRQEANPKGGTLAYWTEAIRKELTDAGYTLKETQPIKAGGGPGMARGCDGTLFEFRTNVGNVEHTYLVAVFVQGQQIGVVEAGGKSDKMAADRDKLLKAIRSLG